MNEVHSQLGVINEPIDSNLTILILMNIYYDLILRVFRRSYIDLILQNVVT